MTTPEPRVSTTKPIFLTSLVHARKILVAAGIPADRLEVCGPGREGVRRWADCHREHAGPVILVGLAGGLVPDLASGRIVVVDEVVDQRGRITTPPAAGRIDIAREPPRPRHDHRQSGRKFRGKTGARPDDRRLHRRSRIGSLRRIGRKPGMGLGHRSSGRGCHGGSGTRGPRSLRRSPRANPAPRGRGKFIPTPRPLQATSSPCTTSKIRTPRPRRVAP